jgi:hypothetical protein
MTISSFQEDAQRRLAESWNRRELAARSVECDVEEGNSIGITHQ